MTNPKFILSKEVKIKTEKIAFSGFVHSCRNLGNVVFFLLQDPFGLIQVIWQKSTLDTKITDLLIGKRMYVLGAVRFREKKATSSTRVNDIIEIEAENCFILDAEKATYSLFTDTKQIISLLKERKAEGFISKDNCFELGVFNFHLISKLRHFMLEADFIEIPSHINQEKTKKSQVESWEEDLRYGCEKGFDRHFYFKQKFESLQTASLELRIALPAFSLSEVIWQANQILNIFLPSFGWEQLESVDLITAEECLSKYGSLEPDFRYPFCINDASYFMNLDKLILNHQKKYAKCLCVPGISRSIFQIEKIIDFVREQTGLSISYLIMDDGVTEGPLKKYIKPCLKISNTVLFFTSQDNPQNCQIALGAIYQYLRKNQLCFLKRCSARWISQTRVIEGCEIISSSLIFNGQRIANCSFESYPYSFLNKGFIVFDLLSLNPVRWKEGERAKLDSRGRSLIGYCSPTPRIDLPILEDELQAEIAINDNLEEKEVISLLELDPKSAYLSWNKIQALAISLSRFAMNNDDAIFLINLLPEKISSVLDLPEHDIFQFLWSILGHKHVVESFRDERARKVLQQVCRLQIVIEYKQILFLELEAILLIGHILESQSPHLDVIARIIKILLNSSPNDFSNLIECLNGIIEAKRFPIDENLSSILLRLSRLGFSTPEFFKFFIHNEKNEKILNEFSSAIRSLSSIVFPNNKIEVNSVVGVFDGRLKFIGIEFDISDNTFYEIIYYLFKPLNMSFFSFKHYYSKLVDRSADISSHNSILLGGKNWDEIENCYYFYQNQYFLKIYPSKNSASFFAKASAGICTGIDLALFQRQDHFHLNLVSPKERRVIGNVQAYVFNNAKKRVLFIRGINPSASYLNQENLGFMLNSVIEAAVQIAQGSGIDQLLLCPSLGIWHAESSRKEIIGAIRILCKNLSIVNFDPPFLLFHFANQDKYINFAYLLWSCEGNNPSASPRFLKEPAEIG